MISKINLAGLLLATLTGVAFAEDLGDCSRSKKPSVQLRACTTLIDSRIVSGQSLAQAYRYRGGANAAIGAMRAAEGDYSEAVRLAPDVGPAYVGRGQVRLALSDLDGAIADFSEAIRLKVNSAVVHIGRGYAYLVKGDALQAIANFSEAIRLDGKSATAFNNRGLAYRKSGNLQAAISDYSAAIQLNPLYALAYNNRGYAYESVGEKENAAEDFARALLIDPSLTGARDGLKRVGAGAAVAAQSERLVGEGQALAEKNCAWCHAIGQEGESPNPAAPEFRSLHERHGVLALRDPLTRGIAAPHDVMPKFSLSNDDIDRMVAYINSLNPGN